MAASFAKERKYNAEYINYGFTSILADGIEKLQFVLCFKLLGYDSMRPRKLKHHLTTIHPQFAKRDPNFFKRHKRSLGKQRLDESGAFQQQNLSVVEASYEITVEIAKKKKAQTIGVTLLKPCALKMVKRVLGEISECKIQQISLSVDTVKRRISEMSGDIMEQVIQEIKSSSTSMFAIQLNESTDKICGGMDLEHETLLFYSKVRWLSMGNVVNRVFEIRGEYKLFLEMKGMDDLLSHFNEVVWEPRLAYLADIFEQLNRLNLKLQGKKGNVFHHMDCIRSFLDKLQNWQKKVSAGNVAMFENISVVLYEIEEDHLLDPSHKNEIIHHLKSLESELKRFFQNSRRKKGNW
ncbi:SCAN domain-containing protein 3-like [Homarus americanus]|uniref:SCAN domain-containing protein 3-like n=1 Tax=Homarus americanus TaxID=6706 RepID=UPI001C45EAA2|nr:SCAN domain-containing protein 3-like [Homarus americanus]